MFTRLVDIVTMKKKIFQSSVHLFEDSTPWNSINNGDLSNLRAIPDEPRWFRAIYLELIQRMLSWWCKSDDSSSTQRVNSAIQASHYFPDQSNFEGVDSSDVILKAVPDNIVLTPGSGAGLVAGALIGATAPTSESFHIFPAGVFEGFDSYVVSASIYGGWLKE